MMFKSSGVGHFLRRPLDKPLPRHAVSDNVTPTFFLLKGRIMTSFCVVSLEAP
jgi:hypothetical protein